LREEKKKKKKTGQNNGCMPVLSPGGWPASAHNLLMSEERAWYVDGWLLPGLVIT
jgi:hypothetical protein